MAPIKLGQEIRKEDPREIGVSGGLDQGDTSSVTSSRVARRSVVNEIQAILDSPEVEGLVAELDALRWTGRKGYGSRVLVGACLAKSLYAIPTWSRVARLIAEHEGLQDALGGCPSVYAMYRFADKLRKERGRDALADCLDQIATRLRDLVPGYGKDIAIDASDIPAYANGMRFVSKNGPERKTYSDPDASWGHRSAISTRGAGGFYGYKIHAAVCTATDLPVAWTVRTAKRNEGIIAPTLLEAVRRKGFIPRTCAMDKGYDAGAVYDACMRGRTVPIIPLKEIKTKNPPGPPTCEHGTWAFAGADMKRKAAKWRCPTGECRPASVWIDASRRDPLIPRSTQRWRDLYRKRAAVEREFGRLKHDYGFAPLRTRRIERVSTHVDLTMLARLAQALARARVVPLAA
jgi:transposase, IS5 family